jgi:hypothetical protein
MLRERSLTSACSEEPSQRGRLRLVGELVPHAADVTVQHRVFVSEHQQFSSLRSVVAEHQGNYAEYPARQQMHDLEQHPASQPSPRQGCWR